MSNANPAAPRPAFPFITVDDFGKAGLIAQRCTQCGATFPDSKRIACGKCGAREDALELFSPGLDGTLHAGVIIRRGFPGIPVPFISAIVDLDDGPTIRGRLASDSYQPDDLRHGRRVRVAFDDAMGRQDKDGNAYVAHYFQPVD